MEFLQQLTVPFYWVSEKDVGIYDAMNKGIELAKGDWLYFIGSDDAFCNSNVLTAIFTNNFDPQLDLILGNIKYNLHEHSSSLLKRNNGVFNSLFSNKLWLKNTVHHQSVFFRKQLFKDTKYDTTYKILADYDLFLKLFLLEKKYLKLDVLVANCGSLGISKAVIVALYLEEIKLKVKNSSIVLLPVFFVIALLKFGFKSFENIFYLGGKYSKVK